VRCTMQQRVATCARSRGWQLVRSWSVLAVAASLGKNEAVRALAWLGANVSLGQNDGATPVYVAAEGGHLEVVKALASLGADVNFARREGTTPVSIAAQNGHVEVVKTLASLGADVGIPLHNGTTPLCVAVGKGHLEVVKALASLGADVRIPINVGRTPVFVGHPEADAPSRPDLPWSPSRVAPLSVKGRQGASVNSLKVTSDREKLRSVDRGGVAAVEMLASIAVKQLYCRVPSRSYCEEGLARQPQGCWPMDRRSWVARREDAHGAGGGCRAPGQSQSTECGGTGDRPSGAVL
jgi:hypothetical protein